MNRAEITSSKERDAASASSADFVVISRNPTSGSSDKSRLVDELAKKLTDAGLTVVMLTDIEQVVSSVGTLDNSDDIHANQNSQPQSKLRAVVAAGGDGTISLLANRLPTGTPLTILPLGTENLLAKHLGITADPEQVANTIIRGHSTKLDAGRANGQLFLVMASCGFDAEVVHRLHANRTGHIRHWSYALPVIRTIRKYQYPAIRISVDDGKAEVKSRWAFVFNVPRYAMNLPIASDADPTDGLLDLCTFRGGSLFRGLYYFFTVLIGQHRRWTTSQRHSFKQIRLESDEPVPFQLDGDPGGELPLVIEVLPSFLRLLVPE